MLKLNEIQRNSYVVFLATLAATIIFSWNNQILLIINLFLCTMTILIANISLVSVWTIIINYIILNVYVYNITGEAYGILNLVKEIHFEQMLIYMAIINLSLFFWGSCTKFCENEEKLINFASGKLGNTYIYLCCAIAIVCSIIAFPKMPFSFSANERFEALLPGNAWNHLVIVSLIAVVSELKKNHIVQCTYLFVAFWFLSHYERVDIIGIFILLIVLIMIKIKGKLKLGNIIKISIVLLGIFTLLTYIGETRMGNSSFSFKYILHKLVSQNTASDIGYGFNSSCDYVLHHQLLYGKSYLVYFLEAIPIFNFEELHVGAMLVNLYNTPGGEFFLSEPMMNFGILGVAIIPNIYISVIYWFIKKNSKYRKFVYLFLIATAFRYLWYGVSYIETALIWFIPFLYLCEKVLSYRIHRVRTEQL